MAYQVQREEPLPAALHRVVQEQVELASEQFAGAAEGRIPIDGAIHDTRRAMKRVRAVLRLVRPGLSSAEYRRAYDRVRDVGRMLAGVRDAAVVRAVVAEIAGQAGADDVEALADACAREAAARAEAVPVDPASVQGVLREVAEVLDRSLFAACGRDVATAGLRRTWGRARRRMPRKPATRPEAFHEWRKAVKFCRHQVELFCPTYPQILDPLAGQLRELSRRLGDHHDLAVALDCIETVAARNPAFAESARVTAARAGDRMHRAAAESLRLGRRLFALRSGAAAVWITACWKVWRQSSDFDSEETSS